jgi:hypothetical protein
VQKQIIDLGGDDDVTKVEIPIKKGHYQITPMKDTFGSQSMADIVRTINYEQ